MLIFRRTSILSSCLAAAPVASAVGAQTLEIAPITVELPAGRMTTSLRITNRGEQPTTIQLRPFAWSQPAGEDQLDATTELLVSPPFATLAAGDSQTVRVVLRRPATTAEAGYRLIIDQLPPIADPGSVRVNLRISLPVFAAPAAAAQAALSWRLSMGAAGKAALIIRNGGTRRAKLSGLKVAVPGMDLATTDFAFRYVLPGSEVTIPLAVRQGHVPAAAASAHVTATSDQGKVEADAPITAAG